MIRELLQAGAEPLAVGPKSATTPLLAAAASGPSVAGGSPAGTTPASSVRSSISSNASSTDKWRWVTSSMREGGGWVGHEVVLVLPSGGICLHRSLATPNYDAGFWVVHESSVNEVLPSGRIVLHRYICSHTHQWRWVGDD